MNWKVWPTRRLFKFSTKEFLHNLEPPFERFYVVGGFLLIVCGWLRNVEEGLGYRSDSITKLSRGTSRCGSLNLPQLP